MDKRQAKKVVLAEATRSLAVSSQKRFVSRVFAQSDKLTTIAALVETCENTFAKTLKKNSMGQFNAVRVRLTIVRLHNTVDAVRAFTACATALRCHNGLVDEVGAQNGE